jgi:hypothetical protein
MHSLIFLFYKENYCSSFVNNENKIFNYFSRIFLRICVKKLSLGTVMTICSSYYLFQLTVRPEINKYFAVFCLIGAGAYTLHNNMLHTSVRKQTELPRQLGSPLWILKIKISFYLSHRYVSIQLMATKTPFEIRIQDP